MRNTYINGEKHLKKTDVLKIQRNVTTASLALVIVLAVLTSATFAWYIYNTNAHTTKVHMAAGASSRLVISDSYTGSFTSSTGLLPFAGRLTPVSTNKITNGFKKATNSLVEIGTRKYANSFIDAIYDIGDVDYQDYYKTTLFLKTNGGTLDVYLSDIGYTNSDTTHPISTAIRIGLVVHDPGNGTPINSEYIFEIDKSHHGGSYNNTINASYDDSYVLNSVGTPVTFSPYSSDNYCIFDDTTGLVTLKADSQKLCTVSGAGGGYGEAVQIDVYIYLEGCDQDCTSSIGNTTLSDIALHFAGYPVS